VKTVAREVHRRHRTQRALESRGWQGEKSSERAAL